MRKYAPEMTQWLSENVPGFSFREIAPLFNKRFNANLTALQIKTVCQKRGIKNGKKFVFSKAQQKYIVDNYANMTYKNISDNLNITFSTTFKKSQVSAFCEKTGLSKNHSPVSEDIINYVRHIMPIYAAKAAKLVNAKFGTSYTAHSINGFTHRHGIKNGLHNSSETCGRKNPVFSERISISNTGKKYIYIKFQNSGICARDWKKKHIWVWEQAHGPVPDGYIIVFLDGNSLNCNLENLCLANDREYMNMYHGKLFSNDPELTKIGLAIVRLREDIYENLKQSAGEKELKKLKREIYIRSRQATFKNGAAEAMGVR